MVLILNPEGYTGATSNALIYLKNVAYYSFIFMGSGKSASINIKSVKCIQIFRISNFDFTKNLSTC